MADFELADVSITGASAVSATVQHEGKELLAYAAPSGTATAHALVVVDARSGNEVNRLELNLPTSQDASGRLVAATGIWMAARARGQVTQFRCGHRHYKISKYYQNTSKAHAPSTTES